MGDKRGDLEDGSPCSSRRQMLISSYDGEGTCTHAPPPLSTPLVEFNDARDRISRTASALPRQLVYAGLVGKMVHVTSKTSIKETIFS